MYLKATLITLSAPNQKSKEIQNHVKVLQNHLRKVCNENIAMQKK